MDKAREAAGQAVDKVKETASQTGEAIGHAAQAVGHAVGQKAEDATSAVGTGIQHLADKVRDGGPESGMLGQATKTVASTLDEAGKYIEHKNLTGMMDDVTGLIKRNPVPALLVGIGLGYLLGRVLRS